MFTYVSICVDAAPRWTLARRRRPLAPKATSVLTPNTVDSLVCARKTYTRKHAAYALFWVAHFTWRLSVSFRSLTFLLLSGVPLNVYTTN